MITNIFHVKPNFSPHSSFMQIHFSSRSLLKKQQFTFSNIAVSFCFSFSASFFISAADDNPAAFPDRVFFLGGDWSESESLFRLLGGDWSESDSFTLELLAVCLCLLGGDWSDSCRCFRGGDWSESCRCLLGGDWSESCRCLLGGDWSELCWCLPHGDWSESCRCLLSGDWSDCFGKGDLLSATVNRDLAYILKVWSTTLINTTYNCCQSLQLWDSCVTHFPRAITFMPKHLFIST